MKLNHPIIFISAFAIISTVQARTHKNSAFKFKEKYPPANTIPIAKPEWLNLIKNISITDAPVYKNINNTGPQPEEEGEDPYCDWTFSGCVREQDLYECPQGQWAITYDDGPSEFSPKLYDFLDQQNLKATFFMVGGQVVKFPDLVLRAYQAGHEIAMHTWSHTYMTTLTNEQIVAELKWNELAIKEVIGVSPRYFRPPYGDIDDRVRDIATALGFIPVIWNHDSNDWAYNSNPTVYRHEWLEGNVTSWTKEDSDVGGVSLEHDLYNMTVDAAIKIIPILQGTFKILPVGVCNQVPVYKEDLKKTEISSTSNQKEELRPSSPFDNLPKIDESVVDNVIQPKVNVIQPKVDESVKVIQPKIDETAVVKDTSKVPIIKNAVHIPNTNQKLAATAPISNGQQLAPLWFLILFNLILLFI